MAEDIDKLVKWACSQGWGVRCDSKGYRRFFDADGNYVACYPATPSNPRRRYQDVLTKLKRAGLVWPPPSKSEHRAERRREGEL